LIIGQCRIEARRRPGWTAIPVHIVGLNEIAKGEFYENVVRKNFTYSEMVANKRAIKPAQREEEAKARMLNGLSLIYLITILNALMELMKQKKKHGGCIIIITMKFH
jgi:hypothetical protein